MNGTQASPRLRLPNLSLPAKVTVTLFLLLIGSGYLVAVTKIYVWHNEADGVPGMSPDDLRAVYHGIEKQVTEQMRETLIAPMLKQVSPGGKMRRHLLKGGEAAERALITWLKAGASEATFTTPAQPGDPSPRQVIANQCRECHNADGGDKEDLPYADSATAEPRYALVAEVAVPPLGKATEQPRTIRIEPMSVRELLQVTHVHILSIPVFTLCVAVLFLMTGLSPKVKLIVAPLPMLATCLDFASWWLARPFEPFIFGIAAAGAIFGLSFGLQIVSILTSMWFGRRTAPETWP